MKLAAIDIGSNAARLQVTQVIGEDSNSYFKRLEYIRYPLRLGKDVFKYGFITKEKEEKLIKLLHAFKLITELYQVNRIHYVATSAMREASNNNDIVQRIKKELNIKLNVISGREEAKYVRMAIQKIIDDRRYLHIDVGGGSTELVFYENGHEISSKSFKVGTIRISSGKFSTVVWEKMEKWLKENLSVENNRIIGVGIGGNINKVASLLNKKGETISYDEIAAIEKELVTLSLSQRIQKFNLKIDRADVILPAIKIYLNVMKWAEIRQMYVPGLGLKDGIMIALLENYNKLSVKN